MIVGEHPDNVNENEIIDAINSGEYVLLERSIRDGVVLSVHLPNKNVKVWLTRKEFY